VEIWSDGRDTIVYDDSGLTFFSGDEVQDLCTITGDPVSLGPRKGLRSATHRIFAVNPELRRAIVGEPGEVPYIFDLTRKEFPKRMNFRWSAAEHLWGNEYLAVLPEDEKLYFRFVVLGDSGNIIDEVEPEVVDAVPAEAGPLRWEGGRPAETSGVAVVEAKGPFAIHKNRFGLAVADMGTGSVLVAAAGEKLFSTVLRFPANNESTLLACPTPDGVCVSVALRENHSAIAFFDRAGTKLHELNNFNRALITGGGMPFIAGENTIAWPHSTQHGTLVFIDMKSGEVLGECKIPGGSAFYDSVTIVDENQVMLGSRSCVTRLKKVSDVEWTGELLERKALPKRIREHHTPVSGAPVLQLKPAAENWKVPAGARTALAFEFTNGGGETSGIEVELSGDVIERGLLVPKMVRLGAAAGGFDSAGEKTRTFRDGALAIPAATEKGTKRTKIDSARITPFEIEVEGVSTGGGFLMVRVRAGNGFTAATGKAIQIA